MTRSRCRSKSRSNRLKRNKTKRYRQTKNKRRRQHGGTFEYKYTPGIENIFKPGQVTDPVLIPGYSEIIDMMQEYDDPRDSNSRLIDQSKKLNDGIKIKNVERLFDCSLPQTQTPIPEDKIIVVRKSKTFFRENTRIECNPEQYYDLASHNFRIFIRDILKWNPFLYSPEHKKKEEQKGWQGYQPHVYKSDKKFVNNDWWESQTWWTGCKETFASAAQQSSSQTPSPPPPTEVDVSSLIGQREPLNTQLSSLTTLINNNLQHVKNSLNILMNSSTQNSIYSDIEKNIEELSTSIQTLNRLTTPQIDTSQLPS